MGTERKRGRPKGTGINDRETLLKIAHLVTANPKMKRTTAIKQAGITNPSVIRRLRDKYQDQEHILLAEVAAKAKVAAAASIKSETGKKAKVGQPAGASAAPLHAANGKTVREEAIHATTQAPKPASAPVDPLAALFEGLNIETLVSQFIGHVLGIETKEIEASPITALIRQQAHLVDLVLPLLISQFGGSKAAKAA